MRVLRIFQIGIVVLIVFSPQSLVGQVKPGLENENTLYLDMRKRLPTAEVNGTLITHGEVEDRMRSFRRTDFFGVYREYDELKPAAFRLLARDKVIDEIVALQEAKKRGIGLGTGEAEAVADQFLPNDENEARRKMEEHGLLDRKMLLDRSARNTVIDKLRAQITADLPEPTEDEMRAFYQAKSRVFEVTPEMVSAREIMIVKPKDVKLGTPEYEEILERVDRLIDRLKRGEDFATLADRNTENPKGIGKGGSMGWVMRGDKEKKIEEVLFSLDVGEIPDRAVRTVPGFHILLVEEKRTPVLQPFEEAIDRIKRGIKIEWFKGWLSEQRRNADIVYYEELPMKSVLEGKMPIKTDRRF